MCRPQSFLLVILSYCRKYFFIKSNFHGQSKGKGQEPSCHQNDRRCYGSINSPKGCKKVSLAILQLVVTSLFDCDNLFIGNAIESDTILKIPKQQYAAAFKLMILDLISCLPCLPVFHKFHPPFHYLCPILFNDTIQTLTYFTDFLNLLKRIISIITQHKLSEKIL